MEEAYPQSGSWSTWFLVKLEFGILVFEEKGKAPGRRGGGAIGYFLGGYVPPGTPNWHPVLKKISPKIDTLF